MGKCIPSENKEEIEGIVKEIIEKIEPLLENEVLEETREHYEVDPEGHLKIMFARVYVRNPVRILTYTNLRPRSLLNVKDLTVAGTPLKYITIHQQKTNASAGAEKVFFSPDEYEVWKMIIGDLNPENPVYAVDKTLRSHIKTAIEKGCGYKLKDIGILCQAVEMNVVTILKMRLLKCVFFVHIQQEGYIETQTPQ